MFRKMCNVTCLMYVSMDICRIWICYQVFCLHVCKLSINCIYFAFHGKCKCINVDWSDFVCIIFVGSNHNSFELNITTISAEMWRPLRSWYSSIHTSLVLCFSVKLVWFIVVYHTVWHITWSIGIHPVIAMVIRKTGFCTSIFYCRFWYRNWWDECH